MKEKQFKRRRDAFFEKMKNGVAVLHAAKRKTRSNDTEYPYRQESNFYYLSGIEEDDAILVFVKSKKKRRVYLFVKNATKEERLWLGERLGVAGYEKECDVDAVFPVETYPKRIKKLLKNRKRLYYAATSDTKEARFLRLTCKELATERGVKIYPTRFFDVYTLVRSMRLIKERVEIRQIKRSIAIAKKAHHSAMRSVGAGANESDLEAKIEYVFAKNGATHNAYGSIVAGGDNATVLHYEKNDRTLRSGELVLIDAGCEYAMYASDITRTFPVNGTFSFEQKALYELVLSVQERIIANIAPGVKRSELQRLSEKLLTKGLRKLGILTCKQKKCLKKQAYKRYYPHGIGHWLGIDVHDTAPYFDAKGKEIALQAGMVLTIEPGIYIGKEDKKAPMRYRGIGIRIEDDILVTKRGAKNLSKKVKKSVADIETLIQSSQKEYR